MTQEDYVEKRMRNFEADQKEWLGAQIAEIPTDIEAAVSITITPAEVGSTDTEAMERLADALDDWRSSLVPGVYLVRIEVAE